MYEREGKRERERGGGREGLTQVVMPLDENLAISSSKLMPPIPMTSIISAGLFRVLGGEREKERGERELDSLLAKPKVLRTRQVI